MHTDQRLAENKILKFNDELRLAELKILYRWEKKEIPPGLKTIITEMNNRNLRSRKFKKDRLWHTNSISFRLADRASKDIKETEIAKSKNGLKKKIKNKYFLVDYNTTCRVRNCYICAQNQ